MTFSRKKKTKKDSGAPRRRVKPLWRRAWVMPLAAAVLMGAAGGAGWWMYVSGQFQRAADEVRWAAISTTAGMGFRVQDVRVSGRNQTDRTTLIEALNIARGAPILALDILDAKSRLENIPWVRAATVERMLPDTILVSIIEREPLALWQKDGKLHLIDAEGAVILDEHLDEYADLLVVVGDGAPGHTADLIALLGTEPELMQEVRAATWVGDRRWNLHLKGDIDVRLPEKDPGGAWVRLAQYQRNHRVLDKNVTVLDLRIPDRLIVKTGPKENGQET